MGSSSASGDKIQVIIFRDLNNLNLIAAPAATRAKNSCETRIGFAARLCDISGLGKHPHMEAVMGGKKRGKKMGKC